MTQTMCPGQDTRFWRPEDIFEIKCGGCGAAMEFFKDEARRRCKKCGTLVVNPKMSMGCAQWCEHAKECLGFDPKELAEEGAHETALTEKLIAAMKKVFGADQKRITHALSVLERAEEIMRREGGDPKVILASAILHDIGIQEAERKHGGSAGVYQEMEGPAIAEPILKEAGLDKDTIEHVLKIIANHHSAKDVDTLEFRVLWDADWLVNVPDEYPDADKETLERKIEKIFKTGAGKALAYKTFLEVGAA